MNEKQMDRLDAEAREQRTASELAPCESQAQSARCSVADGSKAVWSAVALCEEWEYRAKADHYPHDEQTIYRICAHELRREMGLEKSAPAASNTKVSHGA